MNKQTTLATIFTILIAVIFVAGTLMLINSQKSAQHGVGSGKVAIAAQFENLSEQTTNSCGGVAKPS